MKGSFMKSTYLYRQINFGQSQQGAVLILSLILLVVMTLFGLASMNTSIMQEKMASNAQNTNATFQAAESSVSSLMQEVLGGTQTHLTASMNAPDAKSSLVALNLNNPKLTASYQTTYLGEIILTSGNSLNADESSTLLKGRRFEMTGIGAIPGAQAQTVIRQGMEYR